MRLAAPQTHWHAHSSCAHQVLHRQLPSTHRPADVPKPSCTTAYPKPTKLNSSAGSVQDTDTRIRWHQTLSLNSLYPAAGCPASTHRVHSCTKHAALPCSHHLSLGQLLCCITQQRQCKNDEPCSWTQLLLQLDPCCMACNNKPPPQPSIGIALLSATEQCMHSR